VAPGASLVASFNEPIRLKDGGSVTIRDLGPGEDTVITIPDVRVSASGNQVVIDPATDLVAGNPYAVRISANAVEDLAGNPFDGIGDDTTWSFTTTSAHSPPEVMSLAPGDGFPAAIDADLVITFNEPVAKGLAGDVVIKRDDGTVFETIPVNDSRVSVSGTVVTIDPAGTFSPLQAYHVQVASGAIADLGGNPWGGIPGNDTTTWTFTAALAADLLAGTTGVFDENTDAANRIDVEIVAGTLAPFQAAVLGAFDSDLGGVIDWETGVTVNASTTTSSNNSLVTAGATYGTGAGNGIRITFDRSMELYTNDINSQVQVLSRRGTWHNAVLPAGTSATGVEYNMTFGGAPVVEIGAAMPSRSTYGLNGVTAVNFRATATFSSSAPSVIDFSIGGTPGTGDTFLHFAAPDGETITSFGVKWLSETGGTLTNGQRRPILDDLGFIVAGPANTFANWIGGYDVGGQAGLGDDPDGDGNGNGVENHFGTAPDAFTRGLVAGTVTPGANTFTFTHPLNANPAEDLTAGYRWSTDLRTFHDDGAPNGEGTTTVTFSDPMPAGDAVTVTATMTGSVIFDRLFVAIEVTQH
jgi:hypothetical protein